MSAQERHTDAECSYTFTKLLDYDSADGRMKVRTEVSIEGAVSLGKLAHILLQAEEFDARWRSEIGINHQPLKRIGRI